METDAGRPERDEQWLIRAQELGFLGPGPVQEHIANANRFAQAIEGHDATVCADLGSGAGVPALLLAADLPRTQWTLIEGSTTRARWLTTLVAELRLTDRVQVIEERAEITGQGELRGRFDLVTARSFGPPAITAECGAPLLRAGGVLAVSEPPEGSSGDDRWPVAPLELLGLVPLERRAGIQLLRLDHPCPERYPRRVGVPAKRPLYP